MYSEPSKVIDFLKTDSIRDILEIEIVSFIILLLILIIAIVVLIFHIFSWA